MIDLAELTRGMIAALTIPGTIATIVSGLMVGWLVFGRHKNWSPVLAAQISFFLTSAWYLAVLFDVSLQGDNYLMGRVVARMAQTIMFGVAVGIGAYRR